MIEHNATVRGPVVPDSSYVGFYTYINGIVQIGEHVLIGPHCSITSNIHLFNGNDFSHDITGKPIVIEDGCWIQAGCSITAGVHIGKCSMICAGSVVTKDVQAYSIMAGVPAKQIGNVAMPLQWFKERL